MVDTINTPSDWELVVRDPNHRIYEKTGFRTSIRLHVIAHTMRDRWQVQVETETLFGEADRDTLTDVNDLGQAQSKAGQYMRKN